MTKTCVTSATILAVIALFAADASAFYHPTTGRFLSRDPGGGSPARVGSAAARYADGMNLYQYVRSTPTTYVDPRGLLRIPGVAQSTGKNYGDWEITQTNKNAPPGGDGGGYKSVVLITFKPNKDTVCCKEITFIQMARAVGANGRHVDTPDLRRRTTTGWSIDQLPGHRTAWYVDATGYGKYGSAPDPYGEATLKDGVTGPIPSVSIQFETVSVCKKGQDQRKVYGALTWGIDVDANGVVASRAPAATGTHSGEFLSAVYIWNMQSLGPANQRNAPDQEMIDMNYHSGNPFNGGGTGESYSTPNEWVQMGQDYWSAPSGSRTDFDTRLWGS